MAARGPGKFPSWLLSTLGVLALLFGAYLGVDTALFLASAEKSQGQVVEIRHIVAGYGRQRRQPTEFPVVRFQDSSGTWREEMADAGGGFHRWQVGEQVQVAYPQGKPRLARILGFQNQWAGPLLLLLGGIALLAWGRSRARAASPQS